MRWYRRGMDVKSTQRRPRRGRVPKGPHSSGPVDLAAGFAGLGHLAGNRALVGMLARKTSDVKSAPPELDKGDGETEELEERLAEQRLLLDRLKATMAKIAADGKVTPRERETLLLLVARVLNALDQSLEIDDAYDGRLADKIGDLSRLPKPVKFDGKVEDWLMQLAALLLKSGERIHRKLGQQLPPHGSHVDKVGAYRAPRLEVDQLDREIKQLLDQARKRAEPPPEKKKAAGKPGDLKELLAELKGRKG